MTIITKDETSQVSPVTGYNSLRTNAGLAYIKLPSGVELGPFGHKHNFAAVSAPTVNDDTSLGYSIASLWLNISTAILYICTDATDGAAVWKQVYSTSAAIAATAIADGSVDNAEFQRLNGVTSGIQAQFDDIDDAVATYSAADATPSVANARMMVIANAGAVTITNFDDGSNGQLVALKFSDANTTVQHNANIVIKAGADFVSANGKTLLLALVGAVWYEM